LTGSLQVINGRPLRQSHLPARRQRLCRRVFGAGAVLFQGRPSSAAARRSYYQALAKALKTGRSVEKVVRAGYGRERPGVARVDRAMNGGAQCLSAISYWPWTTAPKASRPWCSTRKATNWPRSALCSRPMNRRSQAGPSRTPRSFGSALCQASQRASGRTTHSLKERLAGVALTCQRCTLVNLDQEGRVLATGHSMAGSATRLGPEPLGGLWGSFSSWPACRL
jgi:hypothetical protein